MAIDWSSIEAHGGIPKVRPRVLAKAEKESEHDRKLRVAYEKVNLREEDTCQVSGVKLFALSQNERTRRQHHHLKGRNVKPEWVYEPRRILLCSEYLHKLLQSKAILVDGTDATKPLVFAWNRRMVKPGKEPIRLDKVA
jgi:hypothetical protein